MRMAIVGEWDCRTGPGRLRVCLLQCRKLSAIGQHPVRHLLKPSTALTRPTGAPLRMTRDQPAMNGRKLRISPRSITVAAALVGMVSLAIGAHAALNMRALDAAKAIATEQDHNAAGKHPSRVALVIGNGHYPDANAPLTQPINDARALTASLRQNGFDVDVVEDASRDDMSRAVERLKSKIRA